jgi:hypothetical protein
VGTSGAAAMRLGVVTASARRRPDLTYWSAVATLPKMSWVVPAIVSFSAGPVPL